MKKITPVCMLCLLLLFAGTIHAQKAPGYFLYAQQNGTTAHLMDASGGVSRSWTFPSTAKTGYSTYLLPGGTLLRTVARQGNSFTGGPICGQVQKVDWNGNVVWDYVYSTSEYCTHHDIHPMPNGNILLIAYEAKSAAQATAAGSTKNIVMWPDKIVEVQPTGQNTGTVVWEWRAWDHLVQNTDPSKANYKSSIADNPGLLNINYKTTKDWLHLNGLDYNAELDQIAFSSHNLNEIYIIDHSTTTAEAASHSGGNSGKGGDILYRWGNPAAYFANGNAVINVTHDAHWAPYGTPKYGQLACFNNGGTTSASTIDYVNPPRNGFVYTRSQGASFEPNSFTSRIICQGKTTNMGNSVQLPNGNTVICIALAAKFYEINPIGEVQFTKTLTGGGIPQVQFYSECHVEKTLSAVATVSERIVCGGTSLQLSANPSGGSGYSYSWTSVPPGFTSAEQNPSVAPTSSTTYYVSVSDGECTVSSGVYVQVESEPATAEIQGNATPKQGSATVYTVKNTVGSRYSWTVEGGDVNSGKGTNSIEVQWKKDVKSGSVSVVETNAGNCIGDTKILAVSLEEHSGFSVNPDTVFFLAQDSAASIAIVAAEPWTINVAGNWVSVDKTSGNGNATVRIMPSSNATGDERKTIATIVSGTKTITIAIAQAANEILEIGDSIYYVEAEGRLRVSTIHSNTMWTASPTVEWISVTPDTGYGISPITILVSENLGEPRTGKVVFIAGLLTKELTIIQEKKAGPAAIGRRKVKFTVDMRYQTVNTTGVHVTGNFQSKAGFPEDWSPDATSLTQEPGTSLYSTVVELPVNAVYEYKFLNGNQFYETEIVPEESQVGYQFNDNRWFVADSVVGDTVFVGPILYSENAPFGKKLMRFVVDMQYIIPIHSAGVHIAGTFQNNGWNSETTRMHSFSSGLYEAIAYSDSNAVHTYKFYNGISEHSAESVPLNCSVEGKRTIAVEENIVLERVCFSRCVPCIVSDIAENENNTEIRLYPNPVDDIATLAVPIGDYQTTIRDAIGRTIVSATIFNNNSAALSTSAASAGIYYAEIRNLRSNSVHIIKFVKL